jgi:CubicO group peptidase (beta-lactamase class C family)
MMQEMIKMKINTYGLAVKTIFLFIIFFYNSNNVVAQTGIYVPSMQNSDNLITNFLNNYGIQGASVAISKNGKLVYLRGFGKSDINGLEAAQPYNLFRIASLSKPVTATAIIKLWENGLLGLDDKVFGTGGLLSSDTYLNTANITDNRIYNITVRNLLEHTAGWDRNIPIVPNPPPPYNINFSTSDPISFPLHVTYVLGESNPVSEKALIKFLMEKGLDVDPGTEYHYSNVGYLILGAIIEHLTGMSYEEYVKTEILNPVTAFDMHLGRNLLENKMEREGEYISNFTVISCYGTGQLVPWQYGGWNLEAMDAHGGWVASARDLLKFVLAVDRFNTRPDILNPSSIDTMTAPSLRNINYAKGWQVNQYNNWWHTGSLDGTRSILVRSSGGYAWVVLLNEGGGGNFWTDFDNLIWNCIASTSEFPAFDLFDSPKNNCTNLNINFVSNNSVSAGWDNGDGTGRLLLVREGNPVSKFPLDGISYIGNSTFGLGDNLGDENYVVYSGNSNNVTISGLSPDKKYYFRLFEFNKTSNTGDNALYLLAKSEKDSIDMSNTAVDDENPEMDFILQQNYPNPFNPTTTIRYSIPSNVKGKTSNVILKVYDVLGNEVATLVNEYKTAGSYEVDFDAAGLSSGVYFYKLQAGSLVETKKMLLTK